MLPDALRQKLRVALHKPGNKDKLVRLLRGVSKEDLQQPTKVYALVGKLAAALMVPLSTAEMQQLTTFFVSKRIDPNNPFHLIRLWAMF
jgi:hypothetical protein